MPISTAGTSNNERGFTLVELAVVVTLLALFAVFTIPLFGSTGTSDLGYSARRLSGTVRFLFNEAALTGLEHRLVYDLGRRSYRGRVLEPDGELVDLSGLGGETRLAGDVRFKDLQIPGRGTFMSGEVTVHIDPSGWLEETLVHLQGADGEEMTLHIMPLTGTTEFHDGYHSL